VSRLDIGISAKSYAGIYERVAESHGWKVGK